MNREDIICMAQDAQMPFYWRTGEITYLDKLERFAALVASAEREACAQECEHTAVRMGSEWMAHHCAAAIRARGQA